MDKISIPAQDVVAFDSVGSNVAGLRVLMVDADRLWTSILAGTHVRVGGGRFGTGTLPTAILLTHGHFDHTGSVQELADSWRVPVYVQPLELPYVTGKSEYPPSDPLVGGGVMSLLSKLYPRGPVNLGSNAQLLPADGGIPGFPEWRWIHTPGHTVGHVSLFRESDRLLIAGDGFVTTKQESFQAVATQRHELHGPPAYFTTDWDAARDSVERLARLRPAAVTTGHGKPLAGPDVASALTALAQNFDRVARPSHGRYVYEPAA